VFLYCIDADGLFARSTALLDQLGLNIMDARIMTTDDDLALNLYLVLEDDGSTVTDPQRQQEVINGLEHSVREPDAPAVRVSRRIPRSHRHFETETQITFAPDPANNRTMMRLVTLDRPGLLADVGHAFSTCRIRLHNAKIATVGEAVEDIFFISNQDDQPISDTRQLDCLRDDILQRTAESTKATRTTKAQEA